MFRAKINVAGSSGTTVFSGEMASPPSSSNPWLRLQVVVNKKVVVPYRNPVRIVDPQLLFGYVFRVLAAVFEGCVCPGPSAAHLEQSDFSERAAFGFGRVTAGLATTFFVVSHPELIWMERQRKTNF